MKGSSISQSGYDAPDGAASVGSEPSAAFTLDTSGSVIRPSDGKVAATDIFWSDLDPFTQGYVEAMFASAVGLDLEFAARCIEDPSRHFRRIGFSDLAPETLARIMKDCEARLRHCPSEGQYRGLQYGGALVAHARSNGERFWRWRTEGKCTNFPPLTPYLGDDGKVRFRDGEAGTTDRPNPPREESQ